MENSLDTMGMTLDFWEPDRSSCRGHWMEPILGISNLMQMYGIILRDFPEKKCMKFGLVSYNDHWKITSSQEAL